jgi:hypothetical protein
MQGAAQVEKFLSTGQAILREQGKRQLGVEAFRGITEIDSATRSKN